MDIPTLVARAGLVTLPVTACAPVVGCALAGRGTPWLALPAASVAAFVCGTRAARRHQPEERFGVVCAPAVAEIAEPEPNGPIRVEYRWSDVA